MLLKRGRNGSISKEEWKANKGAKKLENVYEEAIETEVKC